MARDDWAVVVGISRYPEFSDLAAPEHDARAFHDWLVSPTGGDVPVEQAQLIVSSNYAISTSAASAQPDVGDIQAAFERLLDVAERNAMTGNPRRVGRRLYLYLSGHGFAPSLDEAALLTANATRYRVGHHIPGRSYGRWFQRARYFDEVAVFVDCGRDSALRVPVNAPPWLDLHPTSEPAGSLFCAFAVRWSMEARERMFDGVPRGVFTMALMTGLSGAASDIDGKITATSLAQYLVSHTKQFLSAQDLADPSIAKEPDISIDLGAQSTFVFSERSPTAVPRSAVNISPPPGFPGGTIEILDGRLQLVDTVPLVTSGKIRVELPPGIYLARIPGTANQALFEVSGSGDVDVAL